MASKSNPYLISYSNLRSFLKKEIPNNILLFTYEKIVYEEVIDLVAKKLIGKEYNKKSHLSKYYSDEISLETLIGECSNLGFFTEKKIVCYFLVKRAGTKGGLKKDDIESLVKYFSNSNPDTILILIVTDPDYTLTTYSPYIVPQLKVFCVEQPNEKGIAVFIKDSLEGYEISDVAMNTLINNSSLSYENINAELCKLRVFCSDTKIIDEKAVNLCIGVSRDFDEYDFIEAIFSRNIKKALRIYDNITLKKDVEILLLFHIFTAFMAIYKLSDPEIKKVPLNPYRDLRIYKNTDKFLQIYKKYQAQINELKIKNAFDYIYRTDYAMKRTATDKKDLFTALIVELANL